MPIRIDKNGAGVVDRRLHSPRATVTVRYVLNLRETAGDGRTVGWAPRLTVFRRDGDDWLSVAHANFGQVAK